MEEGIFWMVSLEDSRIWISGKKLCPNGSTSSQLYFLIAQNKNSNEDWSKEEKQVADPMTMKNQ